MCEIMRILVWLLLLFHFLDAEVCTIAGFTLEQAERITLQNNKDLCTLCQLYQSAKAGRLVSLSQWLPQIELVSYGYKVQHRQANTRSYSSFISQFKLMQHLFSTDAYYDVKISGLVAENLKLLLEALMIDVLFDVRTAFYQVILDTQNISTAKTNVEILTSLAVRMESNLNRGTSILLNVNQSKVAIANATSQYYQAIKQLEVDLDRLVNLMGYVPGTVRLDFATKEIPLFEIAEIGDKVLKVMKIFNDKPPQGAIYKEDFPLSEEEAMKSLFTPEEICCWEKLALALRPELKSKVKEWQIADEKVQKEKGTYLPELNLEFNYGGFPTYTEFYPSSGLFNQKYYWAVGFSFSWLLFDGCGREFRIREARHDRNAKLCEFRKSVQMSYQEVRFQIFSITESVANFVTAEGNVSLARQTLDLANKQLEIGYITVFDYQIVVDGLIQALYIRDRARFDLIKGYYGLKHASASDLNGCVLGY
jgi:outer membrane protein TolC